MGFKMFNFADEPPFDNLLHAQIIAVPAAVMEYRQHPLFLFREGNQFTSLLHIEGKGFVDDDVLAGV